MLSIDLGARPTLRHRDSATLDAQAASGLSVADYAARIGVSVPTRYQW